LQSLAWKSVGDIEEVVLITLKELIEEQEMLRKFEVSKPSPNQNTLDDIKKRNEPLGKAFDGWKKMVKRIDDLHEGKTPLTVPVTNLVSNQLLVDNVGQAIVKKLDGSKASSASEIRAISAISFVGGGSSFQYSVEQSSEKTSWKGKGNMQEQNIGVLVAAELEISVVMLEFEFGAKFGTRKVETSNVGNTTGKVSSAAFTLSDPDVGDEFDVQIYRDPDYGSLFFLTKAGRSKFVSSQIVSLLLRRCVHEVNTVRREGVALLHASGDGAKRQILPADPAVFEVLSIISLVSPILSDPCAEHSGVQRCWRLCALS
jgi:hypothetical protein